VSESVDRLGTEEEGAENESADLLDEKSRLMVARPERGCLSGCVIARNNEKRRVDVHGALLVTCTCKSENEPHVLVTVRPWMSFLVATVRSRASVIALRETGSHLQARSYAQAKGVPVKQHGTWFLVEVVCGAKLQILIIAQGFKGNNSQKLTKKQRRLEAMRNNKSPGVRSYCRIGAHCRICECFCIGIRTIPC